LRRRVQPTSLAPQCRATSSSERRSFTGRRWRILGKPANVIEKIIEGKLGSFYSQVVLPDQPSIRDPKLTVAQVLAAAVEDRRRQRSPSPGSPG